MAHKRELNQYCTECKKNFCIYCLKDSLGNDGYNNHKENHKIINLTEFMPNKEKITNLKNKLNKKNKLYEEIINSINKRKNELINKINRIKMRLKDEISLLEKIINNYNHYFLNYTYYSIFYSLDDYFKNENPKNKILLNFKNSDNFEDKQKILFEYLNLRRKSEDNKLKLKNGYLKRFYWIDEGIIKKINNDYFFEFFKDEKKIYLSYYDKQDDLVIYNDNLSINFDDEIYSVSISKDNNQIYICLLNEKKVKIIDYNLKEEKLNINQNQIDDTNDFLTHFNKCIKIGNSLFATADDRMLSIWSKNEDDDSNNYISLMKIHIYGKTLDLLLANEDYFISSQPYINMLTLIDIKSLSKKYITNIECVNSSNCFLLFKEYIIINCKKGIQLLLIKTKEICQYIENFDGISENKEIVLDDKENICILNKAKKLNLLFFNNKYYIKIIKLKINSGLLEPFESYDNIEVNENNLKIICLNDGDFILWGKYVYILKEGENELL